MKIRQDLARDGRCSFINRMAGPRLGVGRLARESLGEIQRWFIENGQCCELPHHKL